ncbi:hypothetical protein Y1Q_0018632 [Alligator mississippiensis]|uniref:Uncharacterized protein n=1 Tax=Alligator mississippiensis TaxID=8496 RepID=A0A151NSU2_ALLMI|nr:hypothetical protein Y1Q_0018632 [Alligator mississippiensis]
MPHICQAMSRVLEQDFTAACFFPFGVFTQLSLSLRDPHRDFSPWSTCDGSFNNQRLECSRGCLVCHF